MLPTGLVFPALLRAANTPPASITLVEARTVARQDTLEDEDEDYGLFDQLRREQEQRDADFQNVLQSGASSMLACAAFSRRLFL